MKCARCTDVEVEERTVVYMTEGSFVITAARVVLDNGGADMSLDISFVLNISTPVDAIVELPDSYFYAVSDEAVGTYKGSFLLSQLLNDACDGSPEFEDIRDHLVSVYSSACLTHDRNLQMRARSSGPKMFCEMIQMDWLTGGIEFIRESAFMTLDVQCFGAPMKLQLSLVT